MVPRGRDMGADEEGGGEGRSAPELSWLSGGQWGGEGLLFLPSLPMALLS